MKKRNFSARLICALTLMTVLAACLHLGTLPVTAEETLRVCCGEMETSVAFSDLELTNITGQIVNGKGEVTEIDSDGLLLRDLLSACGIDPENVASVTVTASDEYSASVTGEELTSTDDVCLIRYEDGFRLVVFSDENSRRNVRDVVTIEAEPKQ